MKQLKIALICKNENSKKRDDRSMGYFSYDVPEFTWEHFTPGKNFNIDTFALYDKGFDLIFHEDYPYGVYDYDSGSALPIVFLSIDSTLSPEHFSARLQQARRSNLLLVDHDDITRFTKTKDYTNPVKRFPNTYQFPYCVNDKVFYRDNRERTVDIAYHCSSSAHAGIEQRKHIRQLLHDLSVKHNWNYRSGVLPLDQYAESFRTSKIVVNQSRTLTNRPHRIFDAMACGACVVTSPLPELESDQLMKHFDYVEFDSDDILEKQIYINLNGKGVDDSSYYDTIANNGYNTVMQNHTWSIRAKQLREIINKEFGI